MTESYQNFLQSPSAKQWKKIGLRKRAGVATPLFSIYSSASTGIGELPDLKLLVDWCVKTGMSIIQLLPLNDVGFKFTPYDAESTIALDPMYLSLGRLKGIEKERFAKELAALKKAFPAGGVRRVNYQIKKSKLTLLSKIFNETPETAWKGFTKYCADQACWLDDHAIYKVLKEKNNEAGWESWPEPERKRDASAIQEIKDDHGRAIAFQKWLQWQLYEQLKDAKAYAARKGCLLMGDLPFLVSRDSADVWSHQDYFKLDLAAGAPPDLFFANGQRWGMPPYQWDRILENGYDYLIGKLRYAETFYDFFRIDHAVGLFRIWTIPTTEPAESAGLNGRFDPEDETTWEDHGKRLLDVMLKNTGMLPCAEDLGVVPDCSYRVLKAYSIPGMDVQRWTRDWGQSFDFKPADQYRPNSMVVISTHDMTSFKGWWRYDANTVDAVLFERQCRDHGIDFHGVKEKLFNLQESKYGRLRWKSQITDVEALLGVLNKSEQDAFYFVEAFKSTSSERQKFLEFLFPGKDKKTLEALCEDPKKLPDLTAKAIERANQASSIFSIQLLQDWLSCDKDFKGTEWEDRINVPGTMNDRNWTLTVPWSLEELIKRPLTGILKNINKTSQRI